MMKMKKIQLIRPEVNIEFEKPILGRLFFVFFYFRLIKIGKIKYTVNIPSKLMKDAGHVCVKEMWYICIPIKFGDAE